MKFEVDFTDGFRGKSGMAVSLFRFDCLAIFIPISSVHVTDCEEGITFGI